ncbi:MAG: MBL fold metallo-hydrolase [Oscillospiraceae bacterium]|nr:MBL fold metallo-hydrolase [Oscillospiraceae bacterium]
MQIRVFASGSSGNCLLVSDGDAHIMIDAGISMRRIQSSLARCGLTRQDLTGVLITHEHSDHIFGLGMLAKYCSVPVYAPHTVASRLLGMLPQLDDALQVIPVDEPFSVGSVAVTAFHTPHDTDESVGYRLEGSAVYAHATDTGSVTEELLRGLSGADTVLIEANHDERMLRDGPYPFYLKKRILSARGHLSNADCAALARRLVESGARRVVLGHLSETNNRPELATAAVCAALAGLDAEVYCTTPDGLLSVPVGDEPC